MDFVLKNHFMYLGILFCMHTLVAQRPEKDIGPLGL